MSSGVMTPGLVAFFSVLAVLFAFYAVLAPNNPKLSTKLGNSPINSDNPTGLFEKWIRPAIHNFLPQSPISLTEYAQRNNGIKALLARSGNPWRVTPEEYVILRVLSGGAGLVILLFLVTIKDLPIPYIPAMFIGLALGQFIPKVLLDSAWGKRKKGINRTLPEALDLLRICMNAGQNFSNALIQTVTLLPPGVVKEELGRVILEQAAGKSLGTSLDSFYVRCPTEEVEAFVRIINQSEATGSDIATTLARQSDDTRSSYERKIDIRAQKLQTTLFLPIIALFLPVLLLLIFGPAMSSLTGSL